VAVMVQKLDVVKSLIEGGPARGGKGSGSNLRSRAGAKMHENHYSASRNIKRGERGGETGIEPNRMWGRGLTNTATIK